MAAVENNKDNDAETWFMTALRGSNSPLQFKSGLGSKTPDFVHC